MRGPWCKGKQTIATCRVLTLGPGMSSNDQERRIDSCGMSVGSQLSKFISTQVRCMTRARYAMSVDRRERAYKVTSHKSQEAV
jgi:hypothetical protein